MNTREKLIKAIEAIEWVSDIDLREPANIMEGRRHLARVRRDLREILGVVDRVGEKVAALRGQIIA
jgi:hypothetical protein